MKILEGRGAHHALGTLSRITIIVTTLYVVKKKIELKPIHTLLRTILQKDKESFLNPEKIKNLARF